LAIEERSSRKFISNIFYSFFKVLNGAPPGPGKLNFSTFLQNLFIFKPDQLDRWVILFFHLHILQLLPNEGPRGPPGGKGQDAKSGLPGPQKCLSNSFLMEN
jgi:hypothetical protein